MPRAATAASAPDDPHARALAVLRGTFGFPDFRGAQREIVEGYLALVKDSGLNVAAEATLPAGTLQAVRARFRFNGSDGSCSTGSYDDHDDLVFAVNP